MILAVHSLTKFVASMPRSKPEELMLEGHLFLDSVACNQHAGKPDDTPHRTADSCGNTSMHWSVVPGNNGAIFSGRTSKTKSNNASKKNCQKGTNVVNQHRFLSHCTYLVFNSINPTSSNTF